MSLWFWVVIGLAVMCIAGGIEYAMGRVPICKCGYVRLWVGQTNSAENSQQIADWYSFSHIIHGIALYGILYLLGRRRWSLGLRLLLMVIAEASWEVVENSSFIIERYRHATISLDYYGDSILNSMSDILFCVMGFVMARYLPVWASITLVLVIEIGLAVAIRDNLTLNILMLIHPFQAIKRWQMGSFLP